MSIDSITTVSLPEDFYFVKNAKFQLKPVQQIFISQYVPDMPRFSGPNFMRWVSDVELCALVREEWQKYEAFVASMQGKPYAFTLHDSARCLPLGVGAGFDVDGPAQHWQDPDLSTQHFDDGHWVDGATFCRVKENAPRYANSIVIKDVPANSTILKHGDHFSVGGNLYMANGVTLSDASGNARIDFNWRLHKPALSNDLVDFRKPSGRFVLIEGADGGVQKDNVTGFGYVSMQAIEVPYK
ncbi:MAG: hypothetical protein GY927_15210 [bacterium]|nr:hypothetical protein [bacterium]